MPLPILLQVRIFSPISTFHVSNLSLDDYNAPFLMYSYFIFVHILPPKKKLCVFCSTFPHGHNLNSCFPLLFLDSCSDFTLKGQVPSFPVSSGLSARTLTPLPCCCCWDWARARCSAVRGNSAAQSTMPRVQRRQL
ncbi:hypothetical protein PFLUV_G00152400 [Perca fluviatilis]|uniref:Uncharacterized protein n=1 Tax=Perca fluviatilis TaxID=8168 RepID=A0A6A5EFS9_PERFL|nr:hypothetical protein PFLUV_G00152400 [Perca fluviatilis]